LPPLATCEEKRRAEEISVTGEEGRCPFALVEETDPFLLKKGGRFGWRQRASFPRPEGGKGGGRGSLSCELGLGSVRVLRLSPSKRGKYRCRHPSDRGSKERGRKAGLLALKTGWVRGCNHWPIIMSATTEGDRLRKTITRPGRKGRSRASTDAINRRVPGQTGGER